jgi:hypothetical protein
MVNQMMVERRGSEDWNKLNATVVRIDRDLVGLSTKQERQHQENVVRMDRIEETQQELSKDVESVSKDVAAINRIVTRVETLFNGAVYTGKLLAWLLGIIIALQTIDTLYGPAIRKTMGMPTQSSVK